MGVTLAARIDRRAPRAEVPGRSLIVFITLNDATSRATDALLVPILYVSGILLMAVALPRLELRYCGGLPWWAQLLGALGAVFALGLLYVVVDGILKPAFEGVGPSWLHEELGILATGAICLAVGVRLGRSVSRESHATHLHFANPS